MPTLNRRTSRVEQMILDAATKLGGRQTLMVREDSPGWGDSLGDELRPARWIANLLEKS